ncbi:putative bifunctional diguanylate cyclase/phosphodiesterase [Pseudohaliea rubra]|uniref:Uncharacterized protein n=1 Tax=Pseudohaliea rubra DSM 19751 TaxID=1265313 RepID=A0A095XXY1_9GAMM|nr:bifunctional diguanylate cyclase/phosphodiesterase [Pseudohaliea rubra]KGE04581.1 hypothetical protein HRUBRA_00740 [Pseudohaliea rubra DSM 19751]
MGSVFHQLFALKALPGDQREELDRAIARGVLLFSGPLSLLVFVWLLPGLVEARDWFRLATYLLTISVYGTLVLLRGRITARRRMLVLAVTFLAVSSALQLHAGPLSQASSMGPVAIILLVVFGQLRLAVAAGAWLVSLSLAIGLGGWNNAVLEQSDLAMLLSSSAYWGYRSGAMIFLLGNLVIIVTCLVSAYARALRDLEAEEVVLEQRLQARTEDLTRTLQQVRESDARARQLAYQDDLTGLANRHRIEELYAQRREPNSTLSGPHTLALVNLRNFNAFNDSFGFAEGNLLLRQAGARLLEAARPSEVVARLAADEFLVIMPWIHDAADVQQRLEQLGRALDGESYVAGHPVRLQAAIGAARCPDDGEDFTGLYRAAKRAWTRAKAHGGTTTELFNATLDGVGEQRLADLHALRDAIDGGAIALQFQPILDLRHNRIVSAEGLLRWSAPDTGTSRSPGQFLPLAVQDGRMPELNDRNLQQVLELLESWSDQPALGDIALSFNLSAAELLEPASTEALMERVRRQPDVASRLIIELTESDLVADLDALQAVIAELRALGLRIAIDDFGVGYSSLARLHRLSVDIVKLDGSFIIDLETDPQTQDLVRAVIDIAHRLGARVTAEFVRTAAQATLLREMHCDYAQGEYVAMALPTDALEEEVRRYNNSGATAARRTPG